MTYGQRSPLAHRLAARRERVAAMLADGNRAETIARELGVSARTARRDIDALMAEASGNANAHTSSYRDHLLDDAEALADRLRTAVADEADGKTIAALASAFVRVLDRQAKLTGADEPARHLLGVSVEVGNGPTTAADEVDGQPIDG